MEYTKKKIMAIKNNLNDPDTLYQIIDSIYEDGYDDGLNDREE